MPVVIGPLLNAFFDHAGRKGLVGGSLPRIEKVTPPSQGFGRGSDNTRTAARYQVKLGGATIGSIYQSPRRYMDKANWKVDEFKNGKWMPVKDFFPTRDAAFDFARKHFGITSQKQTDMPEFKKWFGGSKVVDKDGQPLVVYHGTGDAPSKFSSEKRPEMYGMSRAVVAFFTNEPRNADSYATSRAAYRTLRVDGKKGILYGGEAVVPVYLALHNPLTVDAQGHNFSAIPFEGKHRNMPSVEDIATIASERGYDGLIVHNVVDSSYGFNKPTTTYAAFHPTQIKSAIGNRGTFDRNDPVITNSFEDHVGRPGLVGGSSPRGTPVPTGALDSARAVVRAVQEKEVRNLKALEGLPTAELLKSTSQIATTLWKQRAGIALSPFDKSVLDVAHNDPQATETLLRRWAKNYRLSGADNVKPELREVVTVGAARFHNDPKMQPLFDRYGVTPVIVSHNPPGDGKWQRKSGDAPTAEYTAFTINVFDNTFLGVLPKNTSYSGTGGKITIPDESIDGVLHHEYGHHIHSEITKEQRAAWFDLWAAYKGKFESDRKSITNEDPDSITKRMSLDKESISYYSLQNDGEGFAETFAAATAPDYKRENFHPRTHAMLEFMEKLVK